MRRPFVLAVLACALAACGLDVVGRMISTGDPDASVDADARKDGAVEPELDAGDVPDAPIDADAGGDADRAIVPSNVDAALVDPDAGDLVGPAAIDTTALTIDGVAPASGVTFTAVDGGASGIAVLSVRTFRVTRAVVVRGDRALVVVASSAATIASPIFIDADRASKGPGGFPPGAGPGAGARGATGGNYENSGGGGAGHGIAGANGGTAGATPPGAGGRAYDLPLMGGSGGGRGDPANCGGAAVNGGAGGGALQIFSIDHLEVTPDGGVHAGGGGGAGGCVGSVGGSGAGGGAGGYILLEAPNIKVRGVLAANGGGGGGSSQYNTSAPNPGSDGPFSAARGDGGAGNQAYGGWGGSVAGPPLAGGNATNAAGGGGAYGRIHLHVRQSGIDVTGATISPAPIVDGGL